MNLKYKIVRVLGEEHGQHSIQIRYYTDMITEDMIAVERNPRTGEITLTQTDVTYDLPMPPPTGAALHDFIIARAPVAWLQMKEDILNPAIDTSLESLKALEGLENLSETLPVQDTRTPLEKAKERKLQQIAAWRYMNEVKGITLPNGAKIKTDPESQAKVTGAFISIQAGLKEHINWKQSDGTFIQLGLQEMGYIAKAVVDHVQACFSAENMLVDEVNEATTVEEVDAIQIPAVVTANTN